MGWFLGKGTGAVWEQVSCIVSDIADHIADIAGHFLVLGPGIALWIVGSSHPFAVVISKLEIWAFVGCTACGCVEFLFVFDLEQAGRAVFLVQSAFQVSVLARAFIEVVPLCALVHRDRISVQAGGSSVAGVGVFFINRFCHIASLISVWAPWLVLDRVIVIGGCVAIRAYRPH